MEILIINYYYDILPLYCLPYLRNLFLDLSQTFISFDVFIITTSYNVAPISNIESLLIFIGSIKINNLFLDNLAEILLFDRKE